MTTTRRLIAAALVAAGGLGCSEPTSPGHHDQPGMAVVALTSGHPDDGAVFITVRGPGLSAVATDGPPYTIFSRLAGPEELKVIVIGETVGSGQLFTLRVGAVNRVSAYAVQVEQVATRSDSLRVDISGYRASLSAAR